LLCAPGSYIVFHFLIIKQKIFLNLFLRFSGLFDWINKLVKQGTCFVRNKEEFCVGESCQAQNSVNLFLFAAAIINMIARYLLCFFCAFLSFSGAGAQVVLPGLDKEVQAFMKRWHIPGGSLALVKEGNLLYTQAYGKADTDISAQPYHLFRIASLSKPITAMAILKLKEQGKLKLTDKVFGPKGILNTPEYAFADKRIKDITVRHLLQHRGGWNRETNINGDPMFNTVYIAHLMGVPAPASAKTIIRYVLRKKLDFSPGKKFAYSNIGYTILGRVIEQLSGLTYEQYVQENILLPAGITDMRLAHNYYTDKIPDEVKYYEEAESPAMPDIKNEQQLVPWPYGGFNIEAMDAHGGWVASAPDLAKLLAAIDGLGNKPDILSPAELAQMFKPGGHNRKYALGWMVNRYGSAWHTGSLPGSSTLMARLPDGAAWVILFNGRHDSPSYFSELDGLMWRALHRVRSLPSQDLFNSPILAHKNVVENNSVPALKNLPTKENN